MPCDDWFGLLEGYRTAVRAYNEAVESLPEIPGAEFNQSWSRTEVARAKAGVSRAALLDHEHDHRCVTGDPVAKPEPVLQPVEEWVLGDQGQSGG